MSVNAESVAVACCPKQLKVQFLSLTFRDANVPGSSWQSGNRIWDWRDNGPVFPRPDWTASKDANPICYPMVAALHPKRLNPVPDPEDYRIKMKALISVSIGSACACPEKCQIYGLDGTANSHHAILFKSGWIPFSPLATPQDVEVTATNFLPRKVSASLLRVDWYIVSSPKEPHPSYPKMTLLQKTGNVLYVIFGTPDSWPVAPRERGFTYCRTHHAVEWIGGAKSNDHDKIIDYVFKKFGGYILGSVEKAPDLHGAFGFVVPGSRSVVHSNLDAETQEKLNRNPDLLKRLADADWSSFLGGEAGAWPVADRDFANFGAECQAICRLTLGMLRQLGSTSEMQVVCAYADYADPNTAIVKPFDSLKDSTPTGPDATRSYSLVGLPVTKGDKYIEPVMDPSGTKVIPPGYKDQNSVGWNSFEAYLEYRYEDHTGKGVARYWGGGVGENSTNLVHVFRAIVEYIEETQTIYGQAVTSRTVTGVYDYKAQAYQP